MKRSAQNSLSSCKKKCKIPEEVELYRKLEGIRNSNPPGIFSEKILEMMQKKELRKDVAISGGTDSETFHDSLGIYFTGHKAKTINIKMGYGSVYIWIVHYIQNKYANEIFELMKQDGMKLSDKDSNGAAIIDHAFVAGNLDFLLFAKRNFPREFRKSLSHSITIYYDGDHPQIMNETPIHMMSRYSFMPIETIKGLLEFEEYKDFRVPIIDNDDAETCLDVAIKCGSLPMVAFLLYHAFPGEDPYTALKTPYDDGVMMIDDVISESGYRMCHMILDTFPKILLLKSHSRLGGHVTKNVTLLEILIIKRIFKVLRAPNKGPKMICGHIQQACLLSGIVKLPWDPIINKHSNLVLAALIAGGCKSLMKQFLEKYGMPDGFEDNTDRCILPGGVYYFLRYFQDWDSLNILEILLPYSKKYGSVVLNSRSLLVELFVSAECTFSGPKNEKGDCEYNNYNWNHYLMNDNAIDFDDEYTIDNYNLDITPDTIEEHHGDLIYIFLQADPKDVEYDYDSNDDEDEEAAGNLPGLIIQDEEEENMDEEEAAASHHFMNFDNSESMAEKRHAEWLHHYENNPNYFSLGVQKSATILFESHLTINIKTPNDMDEYQQIMAFGPFLGRYMRRYYPSRFLVLIDFIKNGYYKLNDNASKKKKSFVSICSKIPDDCRRIVMSAILSDKVSKNKFQHIEYNALKKEYQRALWLMLRPIGLKPKSDTLPQQHQLVN